MISVKYYECYCILHREATFFGTYCRFLINPYSDLLVFQVTSKMLWSPYLVGISHFGDCMRNVNKSPKIFILQW